MSDPSDNQAAGGPADAGRRTFFAWSALQQVSATPSDVSGVWMFGDGQPPGGMVFIELGRICWVVAHGLRQRLTDLLAAQSSASASAINKVVRLCKERQAPFGEALVEAGLVSQSGLKRALREHSAEGLLRIGPSLPAQFVIGRKSHDASLTFTALELLEQACRCTADEDSQRSTALLDRALRSGGSGVAFRRAGSVPAHPVALKNLDDCSVERLTKLMARFGQLVAPASDDPLEPKVAGYRVDGGGAVAWADRDLVYLTLVGPVETIAVRVAGVRGMLQQLAAGELA